MKKVIIVILLLISCVSAYSFGTKESPVEAKNKITAGLILTNNTLGDEAVNDSCYAGLQKAVDEGLITLRVKKSEDSDDSTFIIEELSKDGVNYIFMAGESNREFLKKIAPQYPDLKFIGVDVLFDANTKINNLFGATFREQDGSYLAGLLAGSLTYRFNNKHEYLNKINRVGVIIGSNDKDYRRYELGFYAGVKEVNPPCEILTINIKSTNSPDKARDAVYELKQKGVDVILAVSGDSDSGVFSAAEENNILVIGSNRDLADKSPNILTSVVKKISIATYLITKDLLSTKEIQTNNFVYGLSEGAISLAPYYNYDRFIDKEINNLIKKMGNKLIKKPETIPDSIDLILFDETKIPEIVE